MDLNQLQLLSVWKLKLSQFWPMDTTSSLFCYITLILHTHKSIYLSLDIHLEGFPGGISNKEPAYQCRRASLVAQLVKNVPATQETQVQSLAQEDPL